jgi:hypothetical protein
MEMQSQEIGALLEALAKAQAIMEGAVEDSANPFFKSSYADLTSVWKACRKPLTQHGLSVVQTTQVIDGAMCLVSVLGHSSGQWIRSVLPVNPQKPDIQSLGSTITYSRRYSLAALVGICPADDDGETAMDRKKKDEDPYANEPTQILSFSIPEDVELHDLEQFIAETAKNSKKSTNYVIAKANSSPREFMNAFKAWKNK